MLVQSPGPFSVAIGVLADPMQEESIHDLAQAVPSQVAASCSTTIANTSDLTVTPTSLPLRPQLRHQHPVNSAIEVSRYLTWPPPTAKLHRTTGPSCSLTSSCPKQPNPPSNFEQSRPDEGSPTGSSPKFSSNFCHLFQQTRHSPLLWTSRTYKRNRARCPTNVFQSGARAPSQHSPARQRRKGVVRAMSTLEVDNHQSCRRH